MLLVTESKVIQNVKEIFSQLHYDQTSNLTTTHLTTKCAKIYFGISSKCYFVPE